MAARVGRQVRVYFGGDSPADEILGVREKGVEFNGEAIDITSDENGGVRYLIDNTSAQDEVNISLSGVTKDNRIKTAWITGERTQVVTLLYPSGEIISGTFFMSSFSEKHEYKGASTFDTTLQSSGIVSYTPPTS